MFVLAGACAIAVAVLGSCLCGLAGGLAGGGVGWLAARRGSTVNPTQSLETASAVAVARAARAEELLALDALARELLEGSIGTRRGVARELGVDAAVLEEWANAWVGAMRGPRRRA